MKAGFITKQHEATVSKASAWAEAVGYVANICLSCHKLEQLNLQEQQLLRKVQAHCRVSGHSRRAASAVYPTAVPVAGCAGALDGV